MNQHTHVHVHPSVHEVNMTEGPLAGKILRFALPLAASSVLQQLFNAADTAVVGRFASSVAMAAVSSNGAVINLLVALFTGLSVGANVVIGNLLGAGKRKHIPEAVHTVMAIALVSGVFLMALGAVIARPILQLMGAPDDVIGLAVVYLRIYFAGMPAILLYNFTSAILRSRGDSKRPVIALTIAGVLNVLLNLLFVIVFKLHVIGVALATVLSNCVSAGMTLYCLMTEEDEFRFRFQDVFRLFRKEYLKTTARIGIPAGLQGMVFSVSNVVIQSGINSFGSDCVAGMGAALSFDHISWCMMNGFSQAAVTFVSQNYGAKNRARCKRSLQLCMLLGIGSDALVVLLMMLFRHPLIHLFTTDEAVIHYAMVRLMCEVSVHFLCGTYEIPAGAMRGMNHSMVPTLITVFGTCVLRLVYVWFIFPLHRTPEMLILVYPISWIITAIFMNTACLRVFRKAFPAEGSEAAG